MDNQFEGRTDDDLFADEFEPVPTPEANKANEEQDAAVQQAEQSTSPAPRASSLTGSNLIPECNPAETSSWSSATSVTRPPTNLSQSRHSRASPNAPRRSRHAPNDKRQNASSPTSVADKVAANTSTSSDANSQPQQPPAQPRANHHHHGGGGGGGGGNADARLGSGANPRTKLTETELAAKMAKMRILAAEKTQKFERAQRDETEHAAAYERGMEEARKRRAADEERRRRENEGRKKMDEERERNRERKLQAMGMKDGGWDDGKEERMAAEDRRGMFRGAHGGVRGARQFGLGASRFAAAESDFVEENRDSGERGGRGRGRRRGGRGGRQDRGRYDDGFVGGNQNGQNGQHGQHGVASKKPANQRIPSKDDFPALPPGPANPKTSAPLPDAIDLLLSPPVGKWDDEVAALDEKPQT